MPEKQTPTGVQDPAPTETATPASPAPGDAPWSQDLAQLFPDEASRAAADQYLRTNVQPRMTQLEQELKESEDARNLWNQLNDDPITTYVRMTEEMFGESEAERILSALNGEQGAQAQAEATQQVADAMPAEQEGLIADPRIASVVEYVEQQHHERQYEEAMEATVKANPDLNEELMRQDLHAFVAAAHGDFNQAVGMYRTMVQKYGQPATAAEVEEAGTAGHAAAEAPPVLTTEGGTAAQQPVQRHQSFDDAFAEWAEEYNAPAVAPPVGPT